MNANAPFANPDDDRLPLLAIPTDLDDKAAAKLLEFFLEAASAIDAHYAAQLLRYYHRPDERQQSLWDDDPPF
jgi:hypothetical protein